jgi:hypothetical protein
MSRASIQRNGVRGLGAGVDSVWAAAGRRGIGSQHLCGLRPARPGPARLGMRLEPLELSTPCYLRAPPPQSNYRGTSLTKKRPPPWDPPQTLGIGYGGFPRRGRFLMSEVPPYLQTVNCPSKFQEYIASECEFRPPRYAEFWFGVWKLFYRGTSLIKKKRPPRTRQSGYA